MPSPYSLSPYGCTLYTPCQSLEASEGRIQFTRNVASHEEGEAPFAILRGTVTLAHVCPAAHASDHGSFVEGRISGLTVFCDESKTPNQQAAECETQWEPLASNAALTEPFFIQRNASGGIDVGAALLSSSFAAAATAGHAASNRLKMALLEEMSLPVLCHHAGPGTPVAAHVPARENSIHWSERSMHVRMGRVVRRGGRRRSCGANLGVNM